MNLNKIIDYILIRKSGLFDERYYLLNNPDVRQADLDPLIHFVRYGWLEGRNPSKSFDTIYYQESNLDVKNTNINPLVHYIRFGKKEGRKTTEGFGNQSEQKPSAYVGRNISYIVKNSARPGPQPGVTGMRKKILNGIYYLRVNGFKEFVKKVFGKLRGSNNRTAVLRNNWKTGAENNPYAAWYDDSLAFSKGSDQSEYVSFAQHGLSTKPPDLKLIAFYLPQFHPFPENDAWWGKGFTEWTNVSKAVPQFAGHYQPRLPGELGFYDLRVPEVQRRQVELAKNYGIYGFCFYYYWFNGRRLLDKPLDQFINDPEIDFPFCVCWANENWTRRWDGRSDDILISQEHSFEYDSVIIRDFVKLFKNPRYIRIDGRPLLIVYRADILHDTRAILDYWKNYSIEQGLGEPFIIAAQTFGYSDPREDGFDGMVEFPPHNGAVIPDITIELTFLNNEYNGTVFRYSDMVNTSIKRIKHEAFCRFNTVSPGWDNDPRRPGNGMTFHGSKPELYARWLDAACRFALASKPGSERLVFINAWNEWGESAYLEPDRRFGYAYLEATADVLNNLANKEYHPKTQPEIQAHNGSPSNTIKQQVESIVRILPGYSNFHEAYAKDKEKSVRQMVEAIDRLLASCVASKTVSPLVSIIIPVYNHFEDTLNCLKSFRVAQEDTPFEVIIIDDGSSDETFDVFSRCEKVRFIQNEENLGFIKSCNKAAKFARGRYLVFLNNDTMVLPGWLDAFVDTFKDNPGAGLVGSKLIYPDGRLQEAGGLMWEDANGINFGRDDDPDKPQYNYLRDSDYCSGASICVPKSIWDELQGFDEIFSPAYYEDTDLAFRIRAHGYSVLYQPFSRVIHLEGATSGTSTSSGIKRFQEINRHKFYERWKEVLHDHGNDLQPSMLYRNRTRRRHALVIDVCTPKPDHDSGSIDTYQYLLMLRKIGYEVTFISVVDADLIDHYVEDLQKRGIECIYKPYLTSIDEYIKQMGKFFDLVFLFRAPYGGQYIDAVRKFAPQAKVVFDTVDLHFLREKRESELKGKGFKLHENVTKNEEIGIMKKADVTIVVSEYEQNYLSLLGENINSRVMPLPRAIPGRTKGFEGRKNIAFIGGYLHKPNVDAVLYFVKEIWPIITAVLPDCEFWIVGSNIPSVLEQLAGEKVKVIGFVSDLSRVFSECKVSVAPLRYGAGIKGKVITSLSYGVPCVATSIASEGMGLVHELNVMVGDAPQEFAAAVVNLYTDSESWEKVSKNGLAFVNENYSLENFEINLQKLLIELGL